MLEPERSMEAWAAARWRSSGVRTMVVVPCVSSIEAGVIFRADAGQVREMPVESRRR